MKKKLFLSILILQGCASTYQPPAPSEGDSSLVVPIREYKFKLVGTTNEMYRLAISDEGGCGTYMKPPPPREKGAESVSVPIPGNHDIFVGYFSTAGNSGCSVEVWFESEADKKYEVKKIGGGFGCGIAITDITVRDAVPGKIKKAKTANSRSGQVCKYIN
jgi:hypothetical protein